jgi:class 3 adenylate cyclase/pimeloyl-ACP methyl ester carboxylesterase
VVRDGAGTHYARTVDGLDIAYQVHGDGPRDLLVVPGLASHVEFLQQHKDYRRFVQRLATFGRVITFDKRGNGLSDRITGAPTLEERVDDARAVLDAVGSDTAVLLGLSEGGPMSILFAATYPKRTSALVLYGTFARFMHAPDYPFGTTPEMLEYLCGPALDDWGEGAGLRWFCPSLDGDEEERRFQGQLERLSATPAAVRSLWRMNASIDVRDILPSVQTETLVLYRAQDPTRVERGRHLAEHIPNARMVELDGVDHYPWIGDADSVIDEIEEFLTGQRHDAVDVDRVLATVVFTDIVGSTSSAEQFGDRRWRNLLDEHDVMVERLIERFRGRKVKSTGDGVLAMFDGPGRAVRCAVAVRDGLSGLGLTTRLGLHAGEVEVRGDDISGIAVHLAQRVESHARPGEVLVSRTVVDLVAGSGITFEDAGDHELKGIDGIWRLFSVATSSA